MQFSIRIANKDFGRFVGDAIRSTLRRRVPRDAIEIVVVVDGSTDDSTRSSRRSPAVATRAARMTRCSANGICSPTDTMRG
jgi:hypothetical protein